MTIRIVTLLIFFLISGLSRAQVEEVDLLMRYNCETNEYDVSLKIMEGSAMAIPDRAQFNAQISIVVPAGENVVITNRYMPLQSNQNYQGIVPMDWGLGNPVYAPAAQPESDFYAIIPKLSPASFYNDLAQEEEVMLFSFVVGATGQYDESVRFFDNGVDPDDSAPGMNGADFSIGMAIGGATQLYNDHLEESCVTSIEEKLETDIIVYPNPFEDQFSVDLSQDVKSVKVMGSEGKIYYQTGKQSKGNLMIKTHDFPSGVYYIRLETEYDIASKKVVKF
ncbi:MAG: T9SS type A sorting domain-containing protein [Bacteroidota bacterium]